MSANVNHIYMARVVDDNGEKILKEIKKQNRKLNNILAINLIFIGFFVVDFFVTKKRLREESED